MELYTSLVRLKQAMNGGHLPAMTSLSPRICQFLDPALTPGLGALEEDAERGLRCPVRGCGVYRHVLAIHLRFNHPEIGGALGLKKLLSIPRSVRLISSVEHARQSERWHERKDVMLPQLRRAYVAAEPRLRTKAAISAMSRERSKTYRTVGVRNLANRCEAQMRHALIDLHNRLGRQASMREARALISDTFVTHVVKLYGSWNAAMARFGFEQYRRGASRKEVGREAVLASLSAWHSQHGSLPSTRQADNPRKMPLIPCHKTVMKAMGADSWAEAMRRVASLLDIRGGRYGLPERPETKVSA